jgi:hypothetical protein
MSPQSYRIVVDGSLGDRFADGFASMAQGQDGRNTVLHGDFVDEAHLHGLLDQIRGLGITITNFAATDNQEVPGADRLARSTRARDLDESEQQ